MKTRLYVLGFLIMSALSTNVAQGQCAQPLVINISPSTNQIICAGSAVNFSVNVSGGNGNYSYQWQQSSNGSSGWSNVPIGGTSYNYSATAANYYRCKVTSEADTCEGVSDVIQVSIYPTLDAGSISGTSVICFGGTPAITNETIATSGGDGNYTYRWRQETSTYISTYIYNDSPSYTPTETASGTYTYYREVHDGCSSTWQQSAGSYTLTIHPEFQPGSISGNETICSGTPAPANASTPATGYGTTIYSWKKDGQPFSGNTPTITPNQSGNYTRWAANTTLCQTTPIQSGGIYVVTVHPEFQPGSISGNETICYNAQPATILSGTTASGGDGNYTYRWKQGTAIITNSNSPSYTPTATASGTHTYTREVHDGCSSTWQESGGSYTLTIRPEFDPGNISGNETICSGTSAPANASTPATTNYGITSYSWQKNGQLFSSYTETITPNQSGIYTRWVTNYPCQTTPIQSEGVYIVTVRPAFQSGSISGSETICYNTQAATILSGTNASGGDGIITYQWRKGVTPNDTLIDNSNAPTYTPTLAGTYKRYAKDGTCNSNFIASTGSYTLTIHPQFSAGAILTTGQTACEGETFNQIGSAAPASGGNGNIVYQWTKNGTSISGATAATYTPPTSTPAGVYVFTRLTKDGACNIAWEQSNGTWTLQVNPLPDIPTMPTGEQSICQLTPKTDYVAHADFATHYIWNIEPASAGDIIGSGDSVSLFWNSAFFGNVQVKVKSANGCGISNFSTALPITLNPAPIAEFIQAPNPVCANQKELIYAIDSSLANVSYEWNITNGVITSDPTDHKVTVNWNSMSAESTGEISVKLTDNTTSCHFTAIEQIAISSFNAPNLNEIIAKTDKNGTPYMLIYPNPTGNFGYQWYKNNIKIKDATEQFYYPPQYGQTLDFEAEYRVYVADMNNVACGNFTKVYTIEKKGKGAEKYFTVSPNPVHNRNFTVSFNKALWEGKTNGLLTISSLTGQKLWEQSIKTLDDIPVSTVLSSGIYIITLTMPDTQQFTEKIIIQ